MTNGRATVVHVVTQLELGGAQEITLLFCRHLSERHFDVHLVAGRGGLLDAEAASVPGVTLHHDEHLVRPIAPMSDIASVLSLARLFRRLRRRDRPMIVHTHSSKAGIVGRWAALLARAEVRVHSIHGFGFQHAHGRTGAAALVAAERLTAPITHAFCPASEANRRLAEELGLLSGGKPAVVLPEGIDADEYTPTLDDREAVRAELAIPAEARLVGMLACLKPQKSPLDFVRVAARVSDARPSTHFFVAGDGVLRAAVEAEIRRLALEERFHLLGWRRDVRRLLGASDALVLTSLWEGLPRVVLQAMAASKPVVASRVDGIPEAVADGESGFLLEPHDVEGFADRIVRLIDEPELAAKMGAAGRTRLKPFLAPAMLERLDGLYESLLARIR